MNSVMPGFALLTAFITPLIIAAAFLNSHWRPILLKLAPWAPIPALACSLLLSPGATLDIPWLFLGAHFGIDETGQVFLFFTSLLWLLSGIFGSRYLAAEPAPQQMYFSIFYLLAMAGNFGLILSLDMTSFFVFYALMSFSSYGLVVHTRNADAIRAGKIYISLVIVGEVLLFSAIAVFAAAGTTSLPYSGQPPDYVVALVLLGFGIKAGALPLHVWLPLAHPAAPVPASAVLSGAMIKAGLLGWLRFLPLGEISMPDWGLLCVVAGLAAAFYGVIIGLTQNNPKTVLAYSSISQMGLMTIFIGIGLTYPQAWPVVISALLFYATHHAFAKGALFLGVGVAAHSGLLKPRVLLVIVIPALALAGLPLTSGAGAKIALKSAIESSMISWGDYVLTILPFTALGTTLLMARFMVVLNRAEQGHHQEARGLWLPWILLIAISSLFFWFWPTARDFAQTSLMLSKIWSALWPIVIACIFSWLVLRYTRQKNLSLNPAIPAGDVLLLFNKILPFWISLWSAARWSTLHQNVIAIIQLERWQNTAKSVSALLSKLELELKQWMTAGIAFVAIFVLIFTLLAF